MKQKKVGNLAEGREALEVEEGPACLHLLKRMGRCLARQELVNLQIPTPNTAIEEFKFRNLRSIRFAFVILL